jgi:hypothetical protein
MKTISYLFSVITTLLLAVLAACAQTTYTGTGDALGSSPGDGAGISSIVVNNTASTISFTINSTQNQASYIFYSIELQILGAPTGYTGFANPFGPAVGISTGENALIDTFGGSTTGGGATPYTYSGGFAAGTSVSYAAGGTGTTSSTIVVPLSSLGLSVGSSFYFDAVSTYTSFSNGGPQGAYGALDNLGYPSEADGSFHPYDGTTHYDSATDGSGTTFGSSATEYTVQPVPEPTTCVLMGLGTLVMVRRVLRRSAK